MRSLYSPDLPTTLRQIQPRCFNDVWYLKHANGMGGTPMWVNLMPQGAPSPGPRWDHSAVYDELHNRIDHLWRVRFNRSRRMPSTCR